MKAAFRGTSPQIVQMDSTYNVETSHYKLNGFCYFSPVTTHGEMALLSWMSTETHENLTFVLSVLKTLSEEPPNYFLIDKDLKEWRAIEEIFPNAVVLYCLFHTMKWL